MENLVELFSRIALLFSGGWILAISFEDWIRSAFFSSLGLTLALLGAFSLGVVNIAAAAQVWIPGRRLALLVPFSIAYLVGAHYWVYSSLLPFYGTDGMAYDHYSALLVLQGQNPYLVDHAPAHELFRIPAFYVTPREAGGLVTGQTYPALSFLLYVPFAIAGLKDMRFVSLGAHILAVLVVYRIAPQPLKGFAPLTLAFGDQLSFTPGAVQDILWVPPLLLSLATINRRRISGSLFGIACSIKPVPWLIAPFLFVHLWKEGGTRFPTSRGLRDFVFFALACFIAFNAPFILWSPKAWLAGILSPALGGNVPLGAGLSTLTQGGWMPLPSTFYLLATGVVALGLLAFQFLQYPKARTMLWWFPAIVMFFNYRSLQNYFVYWYPFVFVALAQWFHRGIRGE